MPDFPQDLTEIEINQELDFCFLGVALAPYTVDISQEGQNKLVDHDVV